jgi:hypothetical protein
MCWTLIVQCPRIGGGSHGELTGRDQDFLGQVGGPLWCRDGRVQCSWTDSKLVGGQHGLVVLLFVLHDHPEGEPVRHQPAAVQWGALQDVEHLVSDLAEVTSGISRCEQWQSGPARPWLLERVVKVVDVCPDGLPPGHISDQPQFLLVADVSQVPHQRGHDLGVLADQVAVVHRVS